MALRPVGDLPPRVYWARRLVVLLIVALVALLVWWLWPSGGDDTTATSGEPSPTPSLSTTPSLSPEPSETTTSKTPKPSDAPCEDSDIEVTVRTDSSTYPAGEDPAITFTVKNGSDDTCVRDVGSAANELRVSSGGVTVWSSDYCSSTEDTEDSKVLGPGDEYVQTFAWDRVLASKGCPSPREQADPGTYQVVALNGDVTSEPAEFVLE